jgi:energy-coupling factor transporter ATP-binding protein EcfA2
MHDAVVIEGLRFAYPPLNPDAPTRWVLDGLGLRVGTGEWLAVMGASDVGKTTLCLVLAGLAPHLTGGELEGRVVVAGRDTAQHPPPALADTVGLLFQEPETQLFNASVEAEVAWGLENLGLSVSEIRLRVDEMLDLFHLGQVRHRAPGELSGGEKKRLALASVLATQPAVLILDEPMGGLDPVGRREVLTALSELSQDRAVTIVMAESDPEAVATFADRLVVLQHPAPAPTQAEPEQGQAERMEPGGRIALEGVPRDLYRQAGHLIKLGVAVPQMVRVAAALNERLGTEFDFVTVDEAREALAVHLG